MPPSLVLAGVRESTSFLMKGEGEAKYLSPLVNSSERLLSCSIDLEGGFLEWWLGEGVARASSAAFCKVLREVSGLGCFL